MKACSGDTATPPDSIYPAFGRIFAEITWKDRL